MLIEARLISRIEPLSDRAKLLEGQDCPEGEFAQLAAERTRSTYCIDWELGALRFEVLDPAVKVSDDIIDPGQLSVVERANLV